MDAILVTLAQAGRGASILPEPLHFLNWGWWVVHIVAVVVVFRALGRPVSSAV